VANTQPTPEVGNRLPESLRIPLSGFGELLKRYRERARMTQQKAAARVAVSRATFAQWETGRHLPSEQRVHDLDRLLDADGELIAVAQSARPSGRLRPVSDDEPAPTAPNRSLLQVLDGARRALLDQLCFDDKERPTGWRHNLVPSDEPPSVSSTAYGLKVLAMHGGPDASTPAVVKWVLDRAVYDDNGKRTGWRARAQAAPRMEITASTIDALLHAGVPIEVGDILRMLGDLVDKTTLARPTILCTALGPLLRVAPDAQLTATLVRALLNCRVPFGDVLLWPEKLLHRSQPLLTPSVAHTAHAVTVLRVAPEELVGDAVPAAEQWIADAEDLNGVTEIIERDLEPDHREELLSLGRFTSTWVVRALAGCAVPDRRRIEHALRYVWARYDPALHFWAWGNGDAPVWMLNDAVAALHDAALALHSTPAFSDSG
jgi:transcriptional regulator with XRE-family HTH domain